MGAIRINSDTYEVNLENDLIDIANGRGTNIPSRIKFNKIFFINKKNAEINENVVRFNINDVEQLKPSISMHIKINATKAELKQYFNIEN